MVRITEIPAGEQISGLYDVMLDGIPVKANFARVSAMPFNCIWPNHQRCLDQTEEGAFVSFSMSDPVEVTVRAKKPFEQAVVRPLSDGIVPETDGQTVRFTVRKPGQYTVEFDGWHNALHLFADPDTDHAVSPEDAGVLYFPAGVHHPGLIQMESGQTLYLERGAVVYGAVLAVNAENIRIVGEGILDGSWEKRNNESVLVPQDISRRNPQWDIYSPVLRGQPLTEPADPPVGSVLLKDKKEYLQFLSERHCLYSCIHLFGCKNVEISGVILRDSSGFTVIPANCENVVIDNLKIIGNWRYNSDGVDFFNCRNCVLKNSFLRCFDDCIVLKGIPGWDTWSMENILVENCVVWCDWGANLEIGAETCAPEYANIMFRDCDCIHTTHAALRVHHCDRARIRNVLYDNVRVEYSKYDLRSVYQESDDMEYVPGYSQASMIVVTFENGTFYSNDRVKGAAEDISYRNVQALTDPDAAMPEILLEGCDAGHILNGVRFHGIYRNGERITDESVVRKNEFVRNISFE